MGNMVCIRIIESHIFSGKYFTNANLMEIMKYGAHKFLLFYIYDLISIKPAIKIWYSQQNHHESDGFFSFKKNITLGFLIQKKRMLTSLKNRV